jgi:hypothetical protein
MREGDLLDLLSVAAVAAAALGAAFLASRPGRRRGQFLVLAAIMAFLAADDALAFHERVSRAAATDLAVSARGDVLFLIPYLPLLSLAFFLLWRAAREARRPANRVIWIGLALLAAALALRALAALVMFSGLALAGWQRTLGMAALHDTELLAWIALAVGLALAARPGDEHAGRRLQPR